MLIYGLNPLLNYAGIFALAKMSEFIYHYTSLLFMLMETFKVKGAFLEVFIPPYRQYVSVANILCLESFM